MNSTIRAWIEKQSWLKSPAIGALNVVFGVLAGVLAAAFNADLINSTPILWFNEGFDWHSNFNGKAFSFWLMVFSFAILWAAREWVSSKSRVEEVQNLERLIQTVAPPDFLEDYQKLYRTVTAMTAIVASNTQDQEKYLEGVRLILDAFIQLAAKWDYRTAMADDRYRANAMLYIPRNEWTDENKSAGSNLLGGPGWEAAHPLADGGLWVDQNLATAQADDVGGVDTQVAPLMLLHSSTRNVNLRGAPRAYETQQLDHVMDNVEITSDWPEGLTAEAQKAAEASYKNDEKALSILSIPIPGNTGLIGVVNIYRDSPGIMGAEDRAVNFDRLMSPFVRELGVIIERIDINRIESSDQGS